jgi:hypothetical protein
MHLTAESDWAELTFTPDGLNARTTPQIRRVRIRRVTGIAVSAPLTRERASQPASFPDQRALEPLSGRREGVAECGQPAAMGVPGLSVDG